MLLVLAAAVVVLFIVAWIVVGLVLKLAWWLLAGAVIGALARAVIPGKQDIGIVATILIGLVGSLIGGIVAHRILHVGSILTLVVSILLAAVLVGAFAANSTRSSSAT